MADTGIVHSKILTTFPDLIHGVSTRHGGVSPEPLGMNLSYSVGDAPENVKENRRIFLHSLGLKEEEVVFQRQIHGTKIRTVTMPGIHDACDALVTDTQGIFLAVSLADCLPILLYDPKRKAVAGIHAGWRGSKAEIVRLAIERMQSEFHSELKNLIGYIGPGAGVCCYEVGEDVAQQFPENYLSAGIKSKPRLDLKGFNKSLMISAGMDESQIEISEYCTICNESLFHSFRRDKERSGRMLAVIGMKKG